MEATLNKKWEVTFALPGAKSRRMTVEAPTKEEAKQKAQRAAPGARVWVTGEAK